MLNNNNNERRRAKRASVSWRFHGNNTSKAVTGEISNVSTSGCLATISVNVKANDALSLRIMASTYNGTKDITVKVLVKHTMTKHNQCFIGFQFLEMKEADRKFIRRFVNEEVIKNPPKVAVAQVMFEHVESAALAG